MRASTAIRFLMTASVCCLMADEPPKGLPARPDASQYEANAKWGNAVLAGSLVPAKQARHLFAFDISKSYVVFEVALYSNGDPLHVARQSFAVKVNTSGDSIHNAEAETVAAEVQRESLPPTRSTHGTNVNAGMAIGWGQRTDASTGQQAHGVYTAGQVGVSSGPLPPSGSKPGATFENRHMLEAQLRVRSLPEGAVEHAVAGYLYFRKADLKTQPDGSYALEYLGDDGAQAMHSVTLSIPRRVR